MERFLFETDYSCQREAQSSGVDVGASEVYVDLGKLEAKGSRLTQTQRKYIAKYLELKSLPKVAAFFNVRTDTISDSVLRGARQMGFQNSVEMYCYALGVSKKDASKKLIVSATELKQLYDSQGGVCSLSGVVLTKQNMVLDHRIPRVKGGLHSIDNVHWVSSRVNSAKGTMDEEAFVDMCCRVALHSRGYRKPKRLR